MDYRNILATGFLLLCGAVFVHSLKSANAFPQGPNVSMGSNPIDNGYGNCNASDIIFQNNSSQDFILTDISKYYDSQQGDTYLRLDGQNFWASVGNFNFHSGLRVPPGSSLTCTSQSNLPMTISGYYTH